MILSNKVYDILKWFALVLLPALGVFYQAMATTWNLPYPTEIVSTIAAIDLFLGVLIGISTNKFNITNPMYRINLVKLVDSTKEGGWILSNSTFEFLTWIAQILIPSVVTLYGGLSVVWDLPYPQEMTSTLIAIDAFLGALLGFSTAQYHKLAAIGLVENKNLVVIEKPS